MPKVRRAGTPFAPGFTIGAVLLLLALCFVLWNSEMRVSANGREQCVMFRDIPLTCSPTKDWTYKCRCPCT